MYKVRKGWVLVQKGILGVFSGSSESLTFTKTGVVKLKIESKQKKT
jgi:hypothetical protein